MTLKDRLGPVARTGFALIGILLLVAAVASAYGDWPVIIQHQAPSFGLLLTLAISLPLALLIIIWSLVGQLKEWRIEGDHLSIRLMSLTSWMRIVNVRPEDIRDFRVESYDYEDGGARTAHWIVMTMQDGRRYKSPRTFQADEIGEASRLMATMRGGSRIIGINEP